MSRLQRQREILDEELRWDQGPNRLDPLVVHVVERYEGRHPVCGLLLVGLDRGAGGIYSLIRSACVVRGQVSLHLAKPDLSNEAIGKVEPREGEAANVGEV